MTYPTNDNSADGRSSGEDASRNSGARGPLGDARTDQVTSAPIAGAAKKPEDVKNQPNFGIIKRKMILKETGAQLAFGRAKEIARLPFVLDKA